MGLGCMYIYVYIYTSHTYAHILYTHTNLDRDLLRFPVDRRLSWRCHKDAPWMSQSQSWGTSEIMGRLKDNWGLDGNLCFLFWGGCAFIYVYFWGCAVTSYFHVLLWIGSFFPWLLKFVLVEGGSCLASSWFMKDDSLIPCAYSSSRWWARRAPAKKSGRNPFEGWKDRNTPKNICFSLEGPQISTKNLGTLPKVLFIYHSNRANLEISLLQPSTKRRGTTRTIMRDLRSVAQKLMHLGSNDRPPNFTMEFWWNSSKPKELQSGKLTHETIMLNREYIFKFGPCFIAMLVY